MLAPVNCNNHKIWRGQWKGEEGSGWRCTKGRAGRTDGATVLCIIVFGYPLSPSRLPNSSCVSLPDRGARPRHDPRDTDPLGQDDAREYSSAPREGRHSQCRLMQLMLFAKNRMHMSYVSVCNANGTLRSTAVSSTHIDCATTDVNWDQTATDIFTPKSGERKGNSQTDMEKTRSRRPMRKTRPRV